VSFVVLVCMSCPLVDDGSLAQHSLISSSSSSSSSSGESEQWRCSSCAATASFWSPLPCGPTKQASSPYGVAITQPPPPCPISENEASVVSLDCDHTRTRHARHARTHDTRRLVVFDLFCLGHQFLHLKKRKDGRKR
jgi:hypothetical protein